MKNKFHEESNDTCFWYYNYEYFLLKWWIFVLYALSQTKAVDTIFSEKKLAEIKKVSFSVNLGLSFQNINSILL